MDRFIAFGYLTLKSWGIVLLTSSRFGQMFILPKWRNIKLIQEIKILLTVGWEMPNKNAKCFSLNPCLDRNNTRKNSSSGWRVLLRPGLLQPVCLLFLSCIFSSTLTLIERQYRIFPPFSRGFRYESVALNVSKFGKPVWNEIESLSDRLFMQNVSDFRLF